jgi:DNA-binding GntR family transcriptional regulator
VTGALYAVPVAREETPRYRQIAADLRKRIESGEFAPGSLLPSEAKLKEHYGAAQQTIRHAVRILREAGLAQPEQGIGVWVRTPPEPGPSQFDVLMGRVDELSETVRQLEGRMSAAERMLRSVAQRGARP